MFGVIMRPFGQMQTRYRGFAKNQAHFFTLFALGNRPQIVAAGTTSIKPDFFSRLLGVPHIA